MQGKPYSSSNNSTSGNFHYYYLEGLQCLECDETHSGLKNIERTPATEYE